MYKPLYKRDNRPTYVYKSSYKLKELITNFNQEVLITLSKPERWYYISGCFEVSWYSMNRVNCTCQPYLGIWFITENDNYWMIDIFQLLLPTWYTFIRSNSQNIVRYLNLKIRQINHTSHIDYERSVYITKIA